VNWFDIILILLAAGFAIQGLMRGFSRLAVGLAATILGILLAAWFYGIAAGYLKPYIENPAAANICGFLVILLGVQAVGALLAWALNRIFKTVGLGWLDRLLGAGFGVAKATLVGIALALIITAFPLRDQKPEALTESTLAPYLAEAAMVLSYATPHELKAGFARSYQRLQQFWRGQARRGAPSVETHVF
jgi:membrane protein required for colicin V production